MNETVKPPKYAYFAYKTEGRARMLGMLSSLSVLSVVLIFAVSLAVITLTDVIVGIGFALINALSFLILTLARKLINARRPYELYDVSELSSSLTARRDGLSFPSRHVFSAFLIGSILMWTSWPLGCIVILLGVIIAVCRVLLLIHFVRDVLAGALIGIISGTVGAFALLLLI